MLMRYAGDGATIPSKIEHLVGTSLTIDCSVTPSCSSWQAGCGLTNEMVSSLFTTALWGRKCLASSDASLQMKWVWPVNPDQSPSEPCYVAAAVWWYNAEDLSVLPFKRHGH